MEYVDLRDSPLLWLDRIILELTLGFVGAVITSVILRKEVLLIEKAFPPPRDRIALA